MGAILEKAGDNGLDSIQIADALIQNISKLQNKRADSYVTVLRPKINSLIKSGIIAKGRRGEDNTFTPFSKQKISLSNLDDYLKNLEDNL